MKTSHFPLLTLVFSFFISFLYGQNRNEQKSTNDLSFLLGEWTIERIYNPGTETQRMLKGSLACSMALDSQFVQCRYTMDRPGKRRGLDVVFFNYNPIYGEYESLWLSSTWPVKVLMQGDLTRNRDKISLNTEAEFQIENEVVEYVKDELISSTINASPISFVRQTWIRTSENNNDTWHHHMTEFAQKEE